MPEQCLIGTPGRRRKAGQNGPGFARVLSILKEDFRSRLYLKTRLGFERLIFRLAASTIKRISPASPSLPCEKPLALGPTTEFPDRA